MARTPQRSTPFCAIPWTFQSARRGWVLPVTSVARQGRTWAPGGAFQANRQGGGAGGAFQANRQGVHAKGETGSSSPAGRQVRRSSVLPSTFQIAPYPDQA